MLREYGSQKSVFRIKFRILLPFLFFSAVFFLASSFTYKMALPGRKISFPRDHFSHPDFKTEWWYYTGHLSTVDGKSYGYQVTFFRFGLRDRQSEKQDQRPLFTDLYMTHFALSDIGRKKFFFRERANRGYEGMAGASVDRYLVWNENWKVEGRGKSDFIDVSDRELSLKLELTPLKPPVLQGQNGFSQKGEGRGRASYYYSLTRLETEGELTVAGKKERVGGLSWMDHEFGSNMLREDQVGWDWFSIQLDNKTEIMVYVIRHQDGSADPYSAGTLVFENGSARQIPLNDFHIEVLDRWKSPRSGAEYPIKWNITIPAYQIDLQVVPFFPEQELVTARSTRVSYWEGAVRISGSYGKKPVQGLGYAEMTGYAGKLKL